MDEVQKRQQNRLKYDPYVPLPWLDVLLLDLLSDLQKRLGPLLASHIISRGVGYRGGPFPC